MVKHNDLNWINFFMFYHEIETNIFENNRKILIK